MALKEKKKDEKKKKQKVKPKKVKEKKVEKKEEYADANVDDSFLETFEPEPEKVIEPERGTILCECGLQAKLNLVGNVASCTCGKLTILGTVRRIKIKEEPELAEEKSLKEEKNEED